MISFAHLYLLALDEDWFSYDPIAISIAYVLKRVDYVIMAFLCLYMVFSVVCGCIGTVGRVRIPSCKVLKFFLGKKIF